MQYIVRLNPISFQKVSAIAAATKFNKFVLVDDINNLIIKVLGPLYENREARNDRRIDIVLDNAGVELVGDFALAEFLISRGFADKVVMHGKSMPWFVSDVTKKDFDWTIEALNEVGENGKKFCARIKQRIQSGELTYENHQFWTFPHAYYQMNEIAPDLYAELGKVILLWASCHTQMFFFRPAWSSSKAT